MSTVLIRGAGGGGGGGSGGSQATPVEASDTLHSYDTGFILDTISEGQIGGLINGLQSVFLDNTPVQNANGSFNFLNLTVSQAHGTPHQAYIPAESDVESTASVSVKVTQAVPVVRTISDPNINSVRVLLYTPVLRVQDSSGNVNGTSVAFTIEIQTNGGGFQNVLTDSFNGKASSTYDRSYSFPLTGTGPWDIRVTRLTADSTVATLSNDLYVGSLTSIINSKLNYPNTALIGMQFDARAFQAIPVRSYDIQGLLVQIPSNYNPVTRTYTGLWDGTFVTAWTNNPAWCFYDLVTNTRYGLGNYISAAAIDKWGLYAIGQYCDQYVPDGFGGSEPRFTLNCYMTTAAEAFQVVAHMASVFRGMTYWGNGVISAVQDAPADPMALFTQGNVIAGQFSYSGASRKAMHTVAMVTWNDPANGYKQATEYVEDPASIATYGVIKTQVVAFGTTSRGQAHRIGQWLLYTEKMESETVVFTAALDSAFIRPGKVFAIQDAHRSGKRFGGRLASSGSTASSLVLDAAILIEAGKTYSVSVVLPDGTVGTATVINAVGSAATLSLSSSLSAAPQPNAIWVLVASDLVPTVWRALAISETAKNEYQITAMAHDPNKYALIEQGIALQPNKTTSMPVQPTAPINIVISEDFVLAGGVVRNRTNIDWDSVQYAQLYKVSWRSVPGNLIDLSDVYTTHAEILDPPVGQIEIIIRAVNVLGVAGIASTASATLLGKSTTDVKDMPATPAATVTSGLFLVVCAWTFGDFSLAIRGTEIWWSGTNDRSTASLLSTALFPAHEYKHVGLSPGQGGYYWFRVISSYGNPSAWYPTSATTGLYATANTDPSALLTQLNGSLGLGQLSSALAQPIMAVSWDALNTAMNLAGTQVSTIGTSLAGLSMISNEQVSRVRMQVSLGNSLAAVVAQATALGANLTLKVQANGAFAAMSLDAPAGGAGSSVIFETDKFAICLPDGTGVKPVFSVGLLGGSPAVGIAGNLIVDQSVTAQQINGTNLVISGNGQFSGNLNAAGGYFSGDITGSTGTFSGSLSAGTVDITKLIGATTNYLAPGTYTLTVPAVMTSMQVILVSGGGGGGGAALWTGGQASGGGGGGGQVLIATFNNLTPGATYTLVVGVGGAGGNLGGNSGSPGGVGGSTYISGVVSSAGGAGGGPGASGIGGAGGAAGGSGGFIGVAGGGGYNTNGGSGGKSYGGSGGVGGTAAVNPTSGTYGGGGGGGYTYYSQGTSNCTGANGANGAAIIQFFNPNGVVLSTSYNALLAALIRQGIATA